MIRTVRPRILQALLVLGFLFGAGLGGNGPWGAGNAEAGCMRAAVAAVDTDVYSDPAPTDEPRDSRQTQRTDGDDDAPAQPAGSIVPWPRVDASPRPLRTAAALHPTHPACAFPPRAPPRA